MMMISQIMRKITKKNTMMTGMMMKIMTMKKMIMKTAEAEETTAISSETAREDLLQEEIPAGVPAAAQNQAAPEEEETPIQKAPAADQAQVPVMELQGEVLLP